MSNGDERINPIIPTRGLPSGVEKRETKITIQDNGGEREEIFITREGVEPHTILAQEFLYSTRPAGDLFGENNPWPTIADLEAHKRLLIATGVLNADGTPSAETNRTANEQQLSDIAALWGLSKEQALNVLAAGSEPLLSYPEAKAKALSDLSVGHTSGTGLIRWSQRSWYILTGVALGMVAAGVTMTILAMWH